MTIPFSYFGPSGTYPTESKVLTGTSFGPTNNLTGNLVLPTESKVYYGIGYGASGSEFTGSYLPQSLSEVPGASTPLTSSSGPGPNIKHVYVDQSIGSGGTGTDVDPYGDFESALAAESPQTNGTQFNIKSGTVINLTAEIAGQLGGGTWTQVSSQAPLVFRGYDSVKNDGGRFEIVCATNTSAWSNTVMNYVSFVDGYIRDSGTAPLVDGNDYFQLINMEFSGASGTYGVTLDNYARTINCNFHDITASYTYYPLQNSWNSFNFYDSLSLAIGYIGGVYDYCIFNESRLSINTDNLALKVANCSFLGDGTTSGIYVPVTRTHNGTILNCLFENCTQGVFMNGTGENVLPAMIAGNSFFNCTTDISFEHANIFEDNETLSASPFEKTGAATFANRHNYFAPANEGNVRVGGFDPSGALISRGAIQFTGLTSGAYNPHPLLG